MDEIDLNFSFKKYFLKNIFFYLLKKKNFLNFKYIIFYVCYLLNKYLRYFLKFFFNLLITENSISYFKSDNSYFIKDNFYFQLFFFNLIKI